jgi:hypothetical protein
MNNKQSKIQVEKVYAAAAEEPDIWPSSCEPSTNMSKTNEPGSSKSGPIDMAEEVNLPSPLADNDQAEPKAAKKTRGKQKINIEFIKAKSKRQITFYKRKSGLMKKAHELNQLTGTEVLLLMASETGNVYTYATPCLQPIITNPENKAFIQSCLAQDDNYVGSSWKTSDMNFENFKGPVEKPKVAESHGHYGFQAAPLRSIAEFPPSTYSSAAEVSENLDPLFSSYQFDQKLPPLQYMDRLPGNSFPDQTNESIILERNHDDESSFSDQ